MPHPPLESTGWSRIDISPQALDQVEQQLGTHGISPTPLDISAYRDGFMDFIKHPEYAGDYRTYGGEMEHCFFEKALEHYISFKLASPRTGEVGIDIGSCKSVVPGLVERLFGATCYQQDLVYEPGVHGNSIGSSADAIPLPDGSVDFMFLHCTFEHFEDTADTGYIRECARLLKPGGRVIILPLYLNANYCNITGETDPSIQADIGFDEDASYYCLIPEWQNRFGRHYSPDSFARRVWEPARTVGLSTRLLRACNWESIDERLWLRWALVVEKAS